MGLEKHEEELLDGDDTMPERSLSRDGGIAWSIEQRERGKKNLRWG
jgi:hypothetical protein